MRRFIALCMLGFLFIVACASGEGKRTISVKPPQPVREISDDTVNLLLRLFSLEPEIRAGMYEGQELPFDREKIRAEFFDYVADAPLEESDRKHIFMMIAYIFSDRMLSEREEAIMRDLVTYFRAVIVPLPTHDKKQIEKILAVTEARLALDAKDRTRRR